MPNLKTAFVMELMEETDRSSTNSLLMMKEAEKRGFEVYHIHPTKLSLKSDVLAFGQRVHINLDSEQYYSLGKIELLDLSSFHSVHLRQHPPFDMHYLATTYVLEKLSPSVKIVNDPTWVRNLPEKLFPLEFPDLIPPTLISRDENEISKFINLHKQVVVKPFDGFFGQGIFKTDKMQPVIEALDKRNLPLIVQPFLPEISNGNIRVVFFGGEFGGAIRTIPPTGEFLIYRGSEDVAHELTEREQEICARLSPILKQRGLYFVGIDIIGGKLIEINVTCTGSLFRLNKVYGQNFEEKYWNALA